MNLHPLLCLLLLASAAIAAKPSADPRATRVVVIQPREAPTTLLSIEGKTIGPLASRQALRFQLPAGKSARLRAGRSGDTTAGHWPVFYTELAGNSGQTIHLVVDLTFGKHTSSSMMATGVGILFIPSESRVVARGAFRLVGTVEASRLLQGLKVVEKGEVKIR